MPLNFNAVAEEASDADSRHGAVEGACAEQRPPAMLVHGFQQPRKRSDMLMRIELPSDKPRRRVMVAGADQRHDGPPWLGLDWDVRLNRFQSRTG